MKSKVAVIDYGFGNIKSVLNALNYCGTEADVINSPEKISNYGGVILPGVGSFGPAADFLKAKGFDEAINCYVKSGNMIFGICLGFQLFFSKGYENGEHKGLNLINGEVKKFTVDDKSLKIPQIGWNSVKISDTQYAKAMFKGIENDEKFYFVHSYYAMPEDKQQASSFCSYGIDFCSSVAYKNIWGSQFHPEKSGQKGLNVLSNFINEVKK